VPRVAPRGARRLLLVAAALRHHSAVAPPQHPAAARAAGSAAAAAAPCAAVPVTGGLRFCFGGCPCIMRLSVPRGRELESCM
jgi:hypothetical protein